MTENTTSLLHDKLCYLCGSRQARTKDHLFSAGLFPKPIPNDLPRRLPACKKCNEGLSKDEELFRVFVASGMAFEKKAGFRIWTERIRPDIQGGRTGLKPHLQSIAKKAVIVSETGVFIGNTVALEMDREIINRVLRKIARGLYYLDTNQVLPNEVQILTGYAENEPEQFLSPPLDEAIKGARMSCFGNGVVTYWRNIIKDDPASSVTWLEFYNDKLFLICTYRERN